MGITINIPQFLQHLANNVTDINSNGNTVGECLDDLIGQYPELKTVFLDSEGKLIHSYDVYINGKSAYPNEMTKPVKDGDKLHVVPVIYGG